jgi:hypothetical protein
MKRVGEHTRSNTDWIRRATLRLLVRNQEISALDAVVIATAVAQVCLGTQTAPEAAIDHAFERTDLSAPQLHKQRAESTESW